MLARRFACSWWPPRLFPLSLRLDGEGLGRRPFAHWRLLRHAHHLLSLACVKSKKFQTLTQVLDDLGIFDGGEVLFP